MRILGWTLYSILIIVIVSSNLYQAVADDQLGMRMIVSAINIGALLVGLFGYVYAQVIYKRLFWAALFWVNVGVSAFQFAILMVLAIGSPLAVLPHAVDLAAFLPLLYVVYRYSSADNPIWGLSLHDDEVVALQQLLGRQDRVQTTSIVKQPEGTLTTRTSLYQEDDHYVVLIEKEIGGETETFRHPMPTLSEVASFLKEQTYVRVGDFH